LTLSGSLNDGVCVSREVIVEAVEIIKLVDIERIVYVNVTKVVPTTVYVPWEIHRFSQLKQNHTTWGNRLCVRVRIFFFGCVIVYPCTYVYMYSDTCMYVLMFVHSMHICTCQDSSRNLPYRY